MPIVGHNETLPLIDLVQNKANEAGSHRFTIEGSRGAGLLVLEGGRIVHAEYGDAAGEDAALQLLTERSTYYLVRSGMETKQRTMNVTLGRLLLAADLPAPMPAETQSAPPEVESGYSGPHSITSMRRADLAKAAAKGPANVTAFPTPTPDGRSSSAPGAAGATSGDSGVHGGSPRARQPLTAILATIGAILVLGAGAFLLALRGSPENPPSTPRELVDSTASSSTSSALEVGDLGPQDRAPTLVEGEQPPVPEGSAAVLSPTITCRILVDADGRVLEAEVYRARPDLAAFEQAALRAVRSYRFQPARVDGEARSMWINYPVRFRDA